MTLTKLQMRQLHNPKGNIILLALFVLLASGVIGILISMMMKDFLRYHNSLLAYHKASSLAKGAGELALAMIYKKPGGFNYTVNLQNKTEKEGENSDQTSNFLTQNFTCPFPVDKQKKEVCPVKYGFDLEIKGTEELKGEPITIPPGLSHIIIAFTLQNPTSLAQGLGDLTINNNLEKLDDAKLYTVEGKNYLVFVNTNTEKEKTIYPNSNSNLVSSETISITAKGNYQGTIVEKQMSAKNGIPDFLKGDNYLGGQEGLNN